MQKLSLAYCNGTKDIKEMSKPKEKVILWPRPYVSYGVKFNGEIDIVQFIFTQFVVYFFEQKVSLHKKVEKQMKGMTAPMKKITWCVIYLIKVNYTSYNYTPCNSTWTCLINC